MKFIPNTNNQYKFDENGNVYSLKSNKYLKYPKDIYSIIFEHGRRNIRKQALINLYKVLDMELKPFAKATNYLVGKNGFVYSLITNCEVKMFLDKDNYLRTSLVCNDGIRRKFRRHRIVAEVYNKDWFEGCIVHHIDEDKQNDDIINLEISTVSKHCSHHAQQTIRTRNDKGQYN